MVSVALCCACSDVVWAVLCCAMLCGVVLRCVVCKAKSKDKGYGKGKVLHIGDYKNPVFWGLG